MVKTHLRPVLLFTFALVLLGSFFASKIICVHAANLGVSAIVVDSTPPKAIIDAPDEALVNDDILFSAANSTDNEGIVQYQWDFGHNSIVTGKNVHKSYDTAGNYTVWLTVSDNAGNEDQTPKSIKISNPTTAATPETVGGIVNRIIDQAKIIGRAISKAIASALSPEPIIKLSPQEEAVVQTSTVATASAISLLNVLTSFSFINILPYLEYIFLKILEAFGIRKRRTPWGVVYDAITKQPVSLAIVRIYDTALNKIKETNVTDNLGRFGFLAQPGVYHMVVAKQGYVWPSKIIPENVIEDDIYQSVYHSSDFTIKSQDDLVNSDIPIDPKVIDKKASQNLVRKVRIFIKNEMLAILLILMLVNFISFILFKDFITGLGELLLISLVFSELKNRRSRFRWGIVYDAITKLPIKDAIVKLFMVNGSREIRKATDAYGRYGFLVEPGTYSVQVEKSGYSFPSNLVLTKNDKDYSSIYHGEPLKIDKDNLVVSANIPLDPNQNHRNNL